MASQNAKELIEELNRHKVEISGLRNSLNELDREKESWFRKKSDLSEKIKNSIKKIRENKEKRDALTQEVKSLKPKRDDANKDIVSKSHVLGKLKKEKISLVKSLDVKDSPSRIKQQIEMLEFKIETEGMPFSKEQQLMKKIKELKRLYHDAEIISYADKKFETASNSIKTIRKNANETHKLIQEKAQQSQILHEEIIKISGEIDKLKVEEEAAFRKFSELKKNFNEASSQLKEKFKLMNEARGHLDRISSEKRERRKQEEESFLKSKEDAVNEKIRKGQKLTTEDLLVFQKIDKTS